MSMSDEPTNKLMSAGGDKKPVANSLLNAFLPDDLVTFQMPVNVSAPAETPPAIIPDATSEIDLGDEDDAEIDIGLRSSPEIPVQEGDNAVSGSRNDPILYDLNPGEIKHVNDSFGFQKDSNIVDVASRASQSQLYPSIPALTNVLTSLDTPPLTFTQIPPQTQSSYVPTAIESNKTNHNHVATLNFGQPPTDPDIIPGNTNNNHPGNTFRLAGHKPKYAQYPGLTSPPMPPMHQPQSVPVSGPGVQQTVPSLGILNIATYDSTTQPTLLPSTLPPHQPQIDNPPASYYYSMPDPGASVGFGSPPSYDLYGASPSIYKQVTHHWFYRKEGEPWKPFSYRDSKSLEEAFFSSSSKLVSVDGGRQDVSIKERIRKPVYWEDTDVTHVQRCLWFYKGPMDSQFLPYSEEFSDKLEEEYELSCRTNTWHKRLEFSGGEAVVLQSPSSFVHFCQQASADEWGSVPESQLRPRIVKRGTDGLQIPPGEPVDVDYLVFLVHGIGSFCDFKFRSVVETVDDFRTISDQLLQTHFKEVTGRVEFLPVQWHKALHGDGGIDEKLKPLTLKSIPKLRHFTNDTLLDILFYTSPVYCQTIMNTVGNEMNRMYSLFLERNPNFNCLSVAVGGHSLGSLILFDLLAHQPEIVPVSSKAGNSGCDAAAESTEGQELPLRETESCMVSYRVGSAGTGQPFISYPALDFQPTAFFAMGSPIAMFVAVRGLDSLGQDFHLPTCPAFFNIFHPYDPVAYRMESLIEPKLDLRPVLIPHHKGRKRFHLELKETMARVGTDLKNRVMESLRVTYKAVTQLAGMAEVEEEVDSAIATELNSHDVEHNSVNGDKNTRIGSLNGGRRIDYVLQEAPHQILNEYLFALSSHVCYWESEDTVLLVLNEILNEGRSTASTPEPDSPGAGDRTQQQSFPYFTPTDSLPSQSFSGPIPSVPTYNNPPSTHNILSPPLPIPGTVYTSGTRPFVDVGSMPSGIDPTAPISYSNVGPPPKTGFLPKN